MIRTVIRLGFLPLLLAGLPSGSLYADLTTGGTLSLEWLVDSSDTIYLLRLTEPTPPDMQFEIEQERVLKIPADPEAVGQSRQAIDQWRVPGKSPTVSEGDQWLVFIRIWEDKQPTIVWSINLTRPLERSATAAMGSDGVPLANKTDIVRAVEERVRLNQRLSRRARQVREIVDQGCRGASPFGDPARLESNLGGFRITIDCDLWDNNLPSVEHGYRIHDEDLLLQHAIVPAEPKYHKQLLQAAGRHHPMWENRASMYLVNYPGEETERVLEEVAARSLGWTDAKYVLWYFKFRRDLSDPLNGLLVGRWRLVGRQELIDLTLADDNTFTASGFARPLKQGEEARPLWRGKGYWVVRDKQLTIWRQDFLHPKVGWMDAHHRTIFADKRVNQMSPEAVILEGGPPMLKVENGDAN